MLRPSSKYGFWRNRFAFQRELRIPGRRFEMEINFAAENIENLGPNEALNTVLDVRADRRACVTCSFQAEDMIVLHILRERIPWIPVLFLETGYHFAETYEYRDRMAKEWSLNLVNVTPKKT